MERFKRSRLRRLSEAVIMHDSAMMAGSQDVYQTLLESTNAIPWRIDWRTKTFSYIGPQIEKLLGWTPASWSDVNDWASRMHPDDREWVVPYCVRQSEAGVDHEADYRAMTSSGDYVWIRDVVHVLRSDSGEVECLVGFMFDISERKKTEEQLAAFRHNLEGLVVDRTSQLRLEVDRRQKLEGEIYRIAEDERRRIGRELHDDLGQRLTGISLLAQAIVNGSKETQDSSAGHARTIQQAASDAVSKVRMLAHGLMPEGPDPESFRNALDRLAYESNSEQMICTFECDGCTDIRSTTVASHLFRIAQEAVSNAIRHSMAGKISIALRTDGGCAVLSVVDNGVGVARQAEGTSKPTRGLGIMEHRASLINFSLTIESMAGSGTTIRVTECPAPAPTET
jgi:PAS domain S-box-containing protein